MNMKTMMYNNTKWKWRCHSFISVDLERLMEWIKGMLKYFGYNGVEDPHKVKITCVRMMSYGYDSINKEEDKVGRKRQDPEFGVDDYQVD